MDLFDLSEDLSIGVSWIKGIERTKSGTRVYVDLGDETRSVTTNIPFDTFKQIINSRKAKERSERSSVENAVKQLAKYQATATP